jgi:hypothetical protein
MDQSPRPCEDVLWTRAEVLREIVAAVAEGLPAPNLISLKDDDDLVVLIDLDSVVDGALWLARYGIEVRTSDHHGKRWLHRGFTVRHGWTWLFYACDPLGGES